jgi:hypothetical protein
MLLDLPSGFRKPNSDDAGFEIELACDWIEASVLFSGESMSAPTVADLLEESQWFVSGEEARRFIDEVWSRLRSRQIEEGGKSPFNFTYQTIHPKVDDWTEVPAHAFCLLLSFARHHQEWAKQRTWNYNQQGEIFESLTHHAMVALFPTWKVFRTGWSSTAPAKLSSVVVEIASRLCGEVGNLKRWNKKEAKEQGLDILCYRQFRDSRGNFPAFFVQCASGQNFIKKLKEPDLGVWNDLVKMVPTSLARKAFSTPFTFPKKQFDQHAIRSEGLLLDRGRLLSSAIHIETWIEPKTTKQILKWAKPHIKGLPWTE